MNKIYYTEIESPVGLLRLLGTPQGLTALYMEAHRHGPEEADRRQWERNDALFTRPCAQLAEYFARKRRTFDLVIDHTTIGGTPFQRTVWLELERIPYGATISYAELARRIGNPAAVRAVGLANGRNPLSIVVPCHRVIGADGRLTGYGGGIDRKRWLIDLESDRTLL